MEEKRKSVVLKEFLYYFVNKMNTEGRRSKRRRLILNGIPYHFVNKMNTYRREEENERVEEEGEAGSEGMSLLFC